MNSKNKRTQTIKALKPIIKECIREMLLEEGLLSNVVAEVVSGMNAPPLVESTPTRKQAPPKATDNRRKQLKETRRRMMEAIGSNGYRGVDLFEGTEPLKTAGSPGAPTAPSSPLSNYESGDKGVDISKLLPGMSDVWKRLI